jgi:tetratricopeptide (TPR) repeat protein
MRRAFEKGDYREVVALGRHATRTGAADARVHYYYGLALIAVGRDHEGLPELDAAVAADSGLAADAAVFLWGMAATTSMGDAARRWQRALELEPAINAGGRGFAVADAYFDERRYAEAATWYQKAAKARPDTAACEQAYARLAECYTELGQPELARQAMETLVARYPRGRIARGVSSSLDDIAYDEARKAFEAGEYERAVETAQDLADRAPNRLLQQKARFLLGSAYEALGDRTRAYAEYREIVRTDRGESGRLVEEARARMAALEEAGVR